MISYYTTRQLTPENRDIHELARQFGAQFIITGNVQFEARKLRVAVQLIETDSGAQIWTELHHRNFKSSNLFEIGDNIISSIVAVLGDFNGVIIQQSLRGLMKNKTGDACMNTLSWYNIFYSGFNDEVFKKAYAAMEYTIEKNPSDGLAWAFYGQLALLAFLFEQTSDENPLQQGLQSVRTALKINPQSQHSQIALAMAHILLNNKQSALDALEYTLTLNPNAMGITGICGCLMIAAGEYNRGIELIRISMSRNKSYPPLFKLFIGLYHFKQKEYSLALACSDEMAIPDLSMNIILRVAILFHLGRKTEADILIKSLKNHFINKSWISKEFLNKFLLDHDLVEQIYNGFKTSKVPFLTVA
jgi:tetratricopeptide (TPR) repeat protein